MTKTNEATLAIHDHMKKRLTISRSLCTPSVLLPSANASLPAFSTPDVASLSSLAETI